jgi:hypothetical protein
LKTAGKKVNGTHDEDLALVDLVIPLHVVAAGALRGFADLKSTSWIRIKPKSFSNTFLNFRIQTKFNANSRKIYMALFLEKNSLKKPLNNHLKIN